MFWFALQILRETLLTVRSIRWDNIINVCICVYIYISVLMYSAGLLCRFEWKWNFIDRFSKNTAIHNFTQAFTVCQAVPRGQTWRSECPLSQFFERVYPQFHCPCITRYISHNALHLTDILLDTIHKTAHRCSQHGVANAWLGSERPGSVIPFSKTFTVLAVHS